MESKYSKINVGRIKVIISSGDNTPVSREDVYPSAASKRGVGGNCAW